MLLEELANLSAPSGYEDEVRNFIKSSIKHNEAKTDILGNLIYHKKGGGKRVMVCAHMDEVALIVTGITNDGFLLFRTVGGIESSVILNKKVYIGDNKIPGIITCKAIHLQDKDESEKPAVIKDLCIDIGAQNKEDAEKDILPGDYAVFDGKFTYFGDGLVKSKALDDRVGCAVLMRLLEENYDSDIYFVFTVQEEIGLRGAKAAAFNINPDIALVIEGTTCSDVYGSKEEDRVTNIGGGPAVTAMDRALIADKVFFDFIKKTANAEKIPFQIKRTTLGGTDAGAIVGSGSGAHTAVIAAPCRYIHSPVSVMSLSDYENLYLLSRAVLKNIERSGL